ncbi:MAG: hypothetical protein ACYC6A_10370 [Armatimonadota bacterium]
MTTPQRVPRKKLLPDSGVNLGKFLPLVLLALIGALALGFVLHLLQRIGLYFIIFVPLILSFLVAWLMAIVVRSGECRNRPLTAIVGAIVGIVFYGSSLYFGMLQMAGFGAWKRVDLLPKYVVITWQYTRTERASRTVTSKLMGEEEKAFTPSAVNTGFNALVTGAEAFLALVISISFAYILAGQAFSREHGRWLSSDVFSYPPGTLRRLFTGGISVEALQQMAAKPQASGGGDGKQKTASANVYFLPASAGTIALAPQRYPVYFEVEDGNFRLQRSELTLEEIAVLAPLSPKLEPYVKAAPKGKPARPAGM